MSTFTIFFPKQAENIANCNQLPDAAKKAFFDESAGFKDKTQIERHARDYFRAHKFLGNDVPMPGIEVVGRLHDWTALERQLAALHVTSDKVAAYRDSVKAGELDAIGELLDCLEDEPMPPVVWCFRNGKAASAFSGTSLESLPCRLGLEKLSKDEYVPFDIVLRSDVTVKNASAFDAGMNTYWCPGGRTCPRAECSDKSGFEEVVMPGFLPMPKLHAAGLTFADARQPHEV